MREMEIAIPDIGDFSAVEVIEILVSVGDEVAVETPVLTLESDKATMEIPSPSAGKITQILVSIGDAVSQGSVVMKLEPMIDSGETTSTTQTAVTENTAKKPDTPAQKKTTQENLTQENSAPKKHLAQKKSKSTSDQITKPHASPSIRRFARELGADLTQIKGSGTKGRILKEDVKLWVKQRLEKPQAAERSAIPTIPEIDFTEFGETETLKLSRIKRLSGPHLQRAWLNIPHVTHHDEADITDLEAFRKSLKDEAKNENLRITILSFVMKVLVNGMKKFPTSNASLSADGQSLILKKYFNIGVAVDTLEGLVVPVVRDVERKSIFDLAHDLQAISEKARAGKLSPADIKGGCISISSLGGIGGTAFTPIVNAPEVAILGISRAKIQPVWNGKDFQPRLVMPISLSYDHRVLDGAEAARFCAYLVQSFADVRRLVL